MIWSDEAGRSGYHKVFLALNIKSFSGNMPGCPAVSSLEPPFEIHFFSSSVASSI